MTVPLHTGSRTVAIGADFVAWDVPCRVVLTDPWQLREAREVLRRELVAFDRTARPRARVVRRLRGTNDHSPIATVARPFPYGVTTAPANATVHHRYSDVDRLDVGRGRRGPQRLDPVPTLAATAVQRCAEAIADTTRCGVLVALEGDLATSGLAPAGGWRVALPAAPDTVPTVLAIDGGAVAVLGLPTGARFGASSSARPPGPCRRCGAISSCWAPPPRSRAQPSRGRCCAAARHPTG